MTFINYKNLTVHPQIIAVSEPSSWPIAQVTYVPKKMDYLTSVDWAHRHLNSFYDCVERLCNETLFFTQAFGCERKKERRKKGEGSVSVLQHDYSNQALRKDTEWQSHSTVFPKHSLKNTQDTGEIRKQNIHSKTWMNVQGNKILLLSSWFISGLPLVGSSWLLLTHSWPIPAVRKIRYHD